jgi:TolB-like protein/DNA-binding winged helix-turn-helix (wHTH) protein/Tfp pilus assembly protein PilF
MSDQSLYTFGPFLLDVRERVLLREGEVVPLAAKVFDTLLLLVENAGRALEKEVLIRTLWPDTFVEEGNLTQNVSRLRKVLGGEAADKYIETLPRRGYRFIGEVDELDPAGAAVVMRRKFTRARVTVTEVTEDGEAGQPALTETGGAFRSIAILPFMTLGLGPESDYLGLGLADALITQLGNTRQLTVRPTSAVRQFVDLPEDSAEIGRRLHVSAVLEGSLQMAGGRLRITVQLVGVAEGTPLWAQKFNIPFTDIFEVQDTIAERVANALLLKLSGSERARLTRRYTDDAEAYTFYLKGRFHWNKRTLDGYQKAIEHFDRAIEHDPTYALAFAGLADCYNMLPVWGDLTTKEACPRSQAYARRALELDDTLAEAHASLGYAIAHYDWDFAAAESCYRRALGLNPNYATAHQWYAKLLVSLERFDEAEAETKLAQGLDPLSLMVSTSCGGPFLYSGRYDEAIARFRKVLELDPNFVPALYSLSICYSFKQMYPEAIGSIEQMNALSGEHPFALACLAATYALAGRSDDARVALERLLEISRERQIRTYGLALVYANLGEFDRAFEWLEKSFNERDGHLVDLKIEPFLAPLRSDPRYRDLVRRVGLSV